jgi:membrane-bound lytic murein transglycosylase D
MIESGFQNHARSKASAVGIWQFMKGTGIQYGLKVNQWTDERRDPEKATEAAIRYLKDLNNVFGSWYLAMAAYNAGQYRIVGSIMKGKSRNFWILAETGTLPRETMDYVPKFIAAMMIDSNPRNYGFNIDPAPIEQDYEMVEIPAPLGLSVVASAIQTPIATLKELNPELRTDSTPRNMATYEIKVPKGKAESIKAARDLLASKTLKKIKGEAPTSDSIHVVKAGESIGGIATSYGVSVRLLRQLNGIKGNRIYAGQRLRIVFKTQKGAVAGGDATGEGKSKYHRVRSGESLKSISRKFGTTITKLKELNGFEKSKIFTGQRLRVR